MNAWSLNFKGQKRADKLAEGTMPDAADPIAALAERRDRAALARIGTQRTATAAACLAMAQARRVMAIAVWDFTSAREKDQPPRLPTLMDYKPAGGWPGDCSGPAASSAPLTRPTRENLSPATTICCRAASQHHLPAYAQMRAMPAPACATRSDIFKALCGCGKKVKTRKH